jgi:hypothetical protein
LKNIISILILLCLLISCGQNKNEKNLIKKEKPEQNFLSYRIVTNEFIEIDIDTLANFTEILDIIEKIDCKKNYALFKLETDENIFKIQPLQVCEVIFDYYLREIIYINIDSITVNYQLKYPIDSLKMVLENHQFNLKNDKNYPLSYEKKLISIYVDSTKNISETKKLLLKIISEINELNTKTNFVFVFSDSGIIQVIE